MPATAKLSTLAAIAAVTDDDLVLLTDAPGGAAASKRITFANFVLSIFAVARTFLASLAIQTFLTVGTYITTGSYATIASYLTVGDRLVLETNVIHKVIKKTGIADASATNLFTITCTNEAGSNDGGVYAVFCRGVVAHGSGPTSAETSCMGFAAQFARAINAAGAAGNSSAVIENAETAVAASTVATKTITSITMTLVETSEYVITVQINVDCAGTTVTTADVTLEVELAYIGFLTPPVIASA